VTATFELDPSHPVFALLAENGIEAEEGLILRRVQGADGRSRAFINDIGVSVQLLRLVGQALVEIHGQHDDRALIDPSGHRELVDAFGGLTGEAARVAVAYAAWQQADAERARHEAEIVATRANADYVTHALDELRTLDPQAGEEETLAERRQLMMHAEKLAGELGEALDPHAAGRGDQRTALLLEPLSDRETTVLRYLPTALSKAEIASEMFVSVNTVKTHMKNIYRKLDVTDRSHAVRRARTLHLV